MRIGDRARVTAGEHFGRVGTVQALLGYSVLLRISYPGRAGWYEIRLPVTMVEVVQ